MIEIQIDLESCEDTEENKISRPQGIFLFISIMNLFRSLLTYAGSEYEGTLAPLDYRKFKNLFLRSRK